MACLLFEHPPWAPGGQAVSVAIRVLAGAPRLAVIQDARRELPRSGFVQHEQPSPKHEIEVGCSVDGISAGLRTSLQISSPDFQQTCGERFDPECARVASRSWAPAASDSIPA